MLAHEFRVVGMCCRDWQNDFESTMRLLKTAEACTVLVRRAQGNPDMAVELVLDTANLRVSDARPAPPARLSRVAGQDVPSTASGVFSHHGAVNANFETDSHRHWSVSHRKKLVNATFHSNTTPFPSTRFSSFENARGSLSLTAPSIRWTSTLSFFPAIDILQSRLCGK